jgi:leucine dehydrogenase
VVEKLCGSYVTAEDVGTTVTDMRFVKEQTAHVSGIKGGDPSPYTAMGVYLSMKEAVRAKLKLNSLRGLKIGVQGVGNVGRHLCHLLSREGALLTVADVNEKEILFAKAHFQASAASIEAFHSIDCDVLAPCALGGFLTSELVPEISAKIICGGANNQLGDEVVGDLLRQSGILYVPDYVANAGGIINVAAEYLGWSPVDVNLKINAIPKRVLEICIESHSSKTSTHKIAERAAWRILSKEQAATLVPALGGWSHFAGSSEAAALSKT